MWLNGLTREALRSHVLASWELTDWLFSGLADDATLHTQPDPLRNPLVFYLGHPAAFYINKLVMAGLLDHGVDARLDVFFARGVDPASAADLELSEILPSADETREYRRVCLARVLEAIDRCDPSANRWNDAAWSILMGLEHERIHFETSSVLFRQVPRAQLCPPNGWRPAPTGGTPSPNTRVRIPAGRAQLGKPADFPTFGWDNEYGHRAVDVPAFEVSRQLVSNLEFRRFVEAGGYQDRSWWSGPGWAWRTAHGVKHPRFWVGGVDGWRLRTVFAEQPLPLAWPVEVNAYEADAYCRWAGARLPTEAEHSLLRGTTDHHRGDAAFAREHHLHLSACSPRAVDAGRPNLHGVHDAFGNVWQWLADDFTPLDGFRTHWLYDDFSTPYFGDQHRMMLGGSWATLGSGASAFYRLWFRPFFYQHAGFRLAWDVEPPGAG